MAARDLAGVVVATVLALVGSLVGGGPVAAAGGGAASVSGPPGVSSPGTAQRESLGGRVELPARRTATSKTFRNADGSLTTSLFSSPVHFRDGERWEPISSELVPVEGAYGWANEANSFRASFKDQLGEDFLRFAVAGEPFTFTLEGAAQVAADAPGKPPVAVSDPASPGSAGAGKPRLGGSSVEYRGAFPGVSVRYDVQASGVKETLVLADAQAPTRYRFLIQHAGSGGGGPVDVVRLPGGAWGFVRAPSAEPLFVLDAPFVAEGGADRLVGVPSREPVSMRVTEVGGAGAGFVVDLVVDRAWLRAPERVFPVLVDPTITVQPTAEDASFSAVGWVRWLYPVLERPPVCRGE